MKIDMDKIKTVAERYGFDPNIKVDIVDRHTLDISFPDGRSLRCVDTSSVGTLVTTPVGTPCVEVSSTFIDFCNELFPTLGLERDMSDIKFDRAINVSSRTAMPELRLLNERLDDLWGMYEAEDVGWIAFWPTHVRDNFGYHMSIRFHGSKCETYVNFIPIGEDEVIPFFAPALAGPIQIDNNLKSLVADTYYSMSFVFGNDLDQIRQLTICPKDGGGFNMVLDPSLTPNGLARTSKFESTYFESGE